MTTVTVMTQWDAAVTDIAEITSTTRKLKRILENYGAKDFTFNVIVTGEHTNQLISFASFSNYEAYGKCEALLSQDGEYKSLLNNVYDIADLTNRVVLNGVML